MFRSFCLVTLMAASISQARGEFINGSIDFNINQKSPVGSISDAIMFADLESGTGSGGFATFESGVPWGNFTINAHDSSSQPLLITTEGFGTFSGAVTSDQLNPVGGSIFRNILVEGIFSPGNHSFFDTFSGTYAASISLPLSSTGDAIAGSSMAFSVYQAVPEPSGVVAIAALAMFFGGRRLYRKSDRGDLQVEETPV